jgi:hypothetical protein
VVERQLPKLNVVGSIPIARSIHAQCRFQHFSSIRRGASDRGHISRADWHVIRRPIMRRKLIVYCELCGGETLSCTADFIVYHRLSFCSPDCREDYRTADEARRGHGKKSAAAAKAA